MRSEREMMSLITDAAQNDERVRAAYMNGSRVNENVQKDAYRDYDVVYVVTDTAPFIADREWLRAFGEIAIMQEPDANDLALGESCNTDRSYGWLMLFSDGVRVDLRVMTADAAREHAAADTLTLPLLDKDGLLPPLPPPSDRGYWVTPPSAARFRSVCNEFWWCLNNVAKGLARGQLPYALRMYNTIVHPQLSAVVEWYIGAKHGFSVSTGMWGKYFERYLPAEIYAQYLATYSDAERAHIWDAVFAACGVFSLLARDVAARMGFEYVESEQESIEKYLRATRGEQ